MQNQDYLISVKISHIDQLNKLRPEKIRTLERDIAEISAKFGGRMVEPYIYQFPVFMNEGARKTAQAAYAIHSHLQRKSNGLYGTTVIVLMSERDTISLHYIQSLFYRVVDENHLWLAPETEKDFERYFNTTLVDGMIRVKSLKEFGLSLEECLPKLLIHPDRLRLVQSVLDSLDKDNSDRNVFLLRGAPGSGKRAVLNAVMQSRYPDDEGDPFIVQFNKNDENPVTPFIRALACCDMDSCIDFLDEVDALWWRSEGELLKENIRKGMNGYMVSDQYPVDMIQAFTLCLKAFVEKRRQADRPAYVIIDGFSPNSPAVPMLRPILLEFLNMRGIRLIIIRDSQNFDEKLPIPGKWHKVSFNPLAGNEWFELVKTLANDTVLNDEEIVMFSDRCKSNLYKLFHYLLIRDSPIDMAQDFSATLLETLDDGTCKTLFLAHTGDGFVDKSMIVERFSNADDQIREKSRYESLVNFGFIREDSGGKVQVFQNFPKNAVVSEKELLSEALNFGAYLYNLFEKGVPIDRFRLFRYLEAYGDSVMAIKCLDKLLDSLLIQRQLRTAGLLINSSPMSKATLDIGEIEKLQNVLSSARMRYVLLTGDLTLAENFARESTVFPKPYGGGRVKERFSIDHAMYFYAVGRWDDALKASKNVLLHYQKSGNHEGATYAHIELALTFLTMGNIWDALEHFEIAQRIGKQINSTWGWLRAATMGTVTQFLYGNLSRSARECEEHRQIAHFEGRRDIWLLLTLVGLRIAWDLGDYPKAAQWAGEGMKVSEFYNLTNEYHVMKAWKGRSLMVQGDPHGREILESSIAKKGHPARRESLAFMAEHEWITKHYNEALRLIRMAVNEKRRSTRIQGESEDWSDGYFPIEGRLADSSGTLDVLGERIRGLNALISAHMKEENTLPVLENLLVRDGRKIPRPFSYQYALWATLSAPESDIDVQTDYIRRAFNDLQTRAGRFDDIHTKHSWLTVNPWNKLLMEKAQKCKFFL